MGSLLIWQPEGFSAGHPVVLVVSLLSPQLLLNTISNNVNFVQIHTEKSDKKYSVQ